MTGNKAHKRLVTNFSFHSWSDSRDQSQMKPHQTSETISNQHEDKCLQPEQIQPCLDLLSLTLVPCARSDVSCSDGCLFVFFPPFNWAELVSLLQRGFETPPNKKSPNSPAGSLTFPSRSLFLCRPMICRSKGRLLFPRSTCSYLQVRLHQREISTAEFFKYVNVTDLKKVVTGSSWSFACFNHIHPSGKQTQGSGI